MIESDPELRSAELICPLPLHPARERERGFNQARVLAVEVAASSGIPAVDALRRVRNTKTQTRLSDDDQRTRNVKHAFEFLSGADVVQRRVLLVDDVMTSGATLDAAGRQILKAGASSVVGVVVAAA